MHGETDVAEVAVTVPVFVTAGGGMASWKGFERGVRWVARGGGGAFVVHVLSFSGCDCVFFGRGMVTGVVRVREWCYMRRMGSILRISRCQFGL